MNTTGIVQGGTNERSNCTLLLISVARVDHRNRRRQLQVDQQVKPTIDFIPGKIQIRDQFGNACRQTRLLLFGLDISRFRPRSPNGGPTHSRYPAGLCHSCRMGSPGSNRHTRRATRSGIFAGIRETPLTPRCRLEAVRLLLETTCWIVTLSAASGLLVQKSNSGMAR